MIGFPGLQYQSSYTGMQKDADETRCTLAQALREAIDKYTDKMMQGLFGLCDEEIAERIEEFKALFYPEGGTIEEKMAFQDKLNAFIYALHRMADSQKTESLITNAAARAAENEMDCIATMIRGKIQQAAQPDALN